MCFFLSLSLTCLFLSLSSFHFARSSKREERQQTMKKRKKRRRRKKSEEEHDTICRFDFVRKAIEHNTIKLASLTIVYTRERTSDKIAFISFFFVFVLFHSCLIFFHSRHLNTTESMCFDEHEQLSNEKANQ
jgi:hypothetical protein